MSYSINRMNDSIIQLLDSYKDTIYILKGKKKSLVFDLGMDLEPLKPLLDSLIETPYDILCSHGHFDHVGRSGEFNEIYMDKKDMDLYAANHTIHEGNGLSYIHPYNIKEVEAEYDLGDRVIKVIPCQGHTPGSILLVDSANKMVFTGDAIGSGCGVWMQVDFALSMEEYRHSLNEALKQLTTYNVDETWTFFGGHARQEYYSKVSEYNPLCLALMKDMEELCQLLLEGKVAYEPSNARAFSTGVPYYARHGKAEMIFTLEQLKNE